jgi:hypothetical protein
MARGRMLDRRFMESKKLQTVPRDARLVYASILPFVDREGRTIAEPLYLKAMVFRHSDFTIEETAAAVRALADAGLVRLYANEDNTAIIEYVDFSKFNSPNAKEAKSDLPGPDEAGAMPCREPLMVDAPAKPVQVTGIASGERNGTSTLTSTFNVNTPPTPPRAVEVQPDQTEDEEADASINLANRRRANRNAAALLTQQHPTVKHALDDLQSIYAWKPTQYGVIAERFLDLARDHGDTRTAAAITHMLGTGATISNPLAYVKKLLSTDTTTPLPPVKNLDLDAIFGPVN